MKTIASEYVCNLKPATLKRTFWHRYFSKSLSTFLRTLFYGNLLGVASERRALRKMVNRKS